MPKVKFTVAVCVPDVPAIATVYCPRLAVLLAVSVNVLLPVVGFGVKDAVTPLGKPETDRFTFPLKPYIGFTETYDVVEVPWPILTLPGPYSVNVGT
jgi:hypothetical protein